MDPIRRPAAAEKRALARRLRRESTPSERHAWSLLRNRRLRGLKFRRQHVLHGFIVDFYCPSLRLVIELDGRPHENPAQRDYDHARAECLTNAGYTVIRMVNEAVSEAHLSDVVGSVLAQRAREAAAPSPISKRPGRPPP